MDVDRAQNVASNCESVKLCHVAKIAAHHRHQQHPGGFHLALVVGIQAWLDDKWHSCVLLASPDSPLEPIAQRNKTDSASCPMAFKCAHKLRSNKYPINLEPN